MIEYAEQKGSTVYVMALTEAIYGIELVRCWVIHPTP